MCVREGETAGTTTRSCKCWHNGQRGRRGGRRKGEAQTARFDPQITPGSCSASAEPPFGRREEGWTCMFLSRSCTPTQPSCYKNTGMGDLVVLTDEVSRTLSEISPLWAGSCWGGCRCRPSPARRSVEVCSMWSGSSPFSHQPWQTPSAYLSLLSVYVYDLVQSNKRPGQTKDNVQLWCDTWQVKRMDIQLIGL